MKNVGNIGDRWWACATLDDEISPRVIYFKTNLEQNRILLVITDSSPIKSFKCGLTAINKHGK